VFAFRLCVYNTDTTQRPLVKSTWHTIYNATQLSTWDTIYNATQLSTWDTLYNAIHDGNMAY